MDDFRLTRMNANVNEDGAISLRVRVSASRNHELDEGVACIIDSPSAATVQLGVS